MGARRLRRSILAALIPLWASLQPALAQELKVVDGVAGGRVLEASFGWPCPLRQARHSLGVSSLTARDVASVSNQMASISEVVELTHMAEPRLQIVSAEYDEVRISLEGDDEEMEFLREYLGVSPAFATGTGLQRRRPVTTIVFPSVTYDFDTQTLRRYRRIVARVQQPAAPASDGRFSRAAAATNPHVEVTRSVLAYGIVFQFPIEEEGVYRIHGALLRQWLTAAGQSPSSVDASSIRL